MSEDWRDVLIRQLQAEADAQARPATVKVNWQSEGF